MIPICGSSQGWLLTIFSWECVTFSWFFVGQVISDYPLNIVSARCGGSRFCYSPFNSVDVYFHRQLTLWNKCHLACSREQIQSQLGPSIFTCAALSLSQCMCGSGVNQRLRHSLCTQPGALLVWFSLFWNSPLTLK